MAKSNKWIIKPETDNCREKAEEISKSLSVGSLLSKVLVLRGYDTPLAAKKFLNLEAEHLHNPFLLKDMDKAVERILKAVEDGERITVYGDYDVDGVTSVSSLYLYLLDLGANVDYYIPNRLSEGYGINAAAIDGLKANGTSLVITVDTGITAAEETEYMKSVGIEAVITDHHRCQDVIPDAVAVVNPKRPDDTYPFKELAGVGVVFKLLTALEFAVQEKKIFGSLGTGLSPDKRCLRLIESGESDFLEKVCGEYIDLVAIGTIADVMTLTDENRLICAAGLSKIEHSAGMGIESLIDLATDRKNQKFPKKRKINSSFIGYTVAPRINAAGRVADARLGVELFTCSDKVDAERVATTLCELNVSRQNEENRISEEAMSLAEKTHNFAEDPVLVLAGDNWHHGVIGIVSSRITEKYNLPSILISVEDGIGKGSGRSISGLNISDALESCKDILEKYGGHDLAAGLTVKAENIDELRRRINKYAREHIDLLDNGAKIEVDCEVDSSELTLENAEELMRLEPCGTGNPQPVFIARGLYVSSVASIGGGKYTKILLKTEKGDIDALSFSASVAEADLEKGDTLDVVFNLGINEFMGRKNAQLHIIDAKITGIGDYYKSECDFLSRAEKGAKFTESDGLLPDRDDFAAVYKEVRAIASCGEYISLYRLHKKIEAAGLKMRAAKLKLALEILSDVGLISLETLPSVSLSGTENYKIAVARTTEKVNLFGVPRYKNLKKQQA